MTRKKRALPERPERIAAENDKMQGDEAQAWRSARRWRQTPVVLKIDAEAMAKDGYAFGMADAGVWCTESVPVEYVCERRSDHAGF